jgi:hypothetical protein
MMTMEAIAAFSLLDTQDGARLFSSTRDRHRYMHRRAFRLSRLNKTPQMFDPFILEMFVALLLGLSFWTMQLSAYDASAISSYRAFMTHSVSQRLMVRL